MNSRGKGRMGFILPVSNSNLEPDMMATYPQGVSLHFMRAGGYDLEKIPDSEQMQQFAQSPLDNVLNALCAVKPDIIVYGCTSASFSLGINYDIALKDKIESFAKVPAVTAASALVETLNDLQINQVSFTSPYTKQLNQEGADFMKQKGIKIANVAYIGDILGNYELSELSPDSVFELGLKANNKDAQAIVLSCTDIRSVEVIESLEKELGKPVVSSNQALMYIASKRLKMKSHVPGKVGQLVL